MNKNRRKYLVNAISLLNDACNIINDVCNEESDTFENLPEGIQSSERGELMEENVNNLCEWSDVIKDIIDGLSEM